MADFLTTSAKFKCMGSPAVEFTVIEGTNKKVFHDGKIVLTTDAKLIGRGVCIPKSPQTPPPCTCSLKGWILPDNNSSVCGKNLLTSQSRNFCQSAPTPVPIIFSSNACRNFQEGSSVQNVSMTFSAAAQNEKTSEDNKENSASLQENSVDKENKSAQNKISDKAQGEKLNNAVVDKKQIPKGKKNFRCSSCFRKSNCKYFMEGKVEDNFLGKIVRKKKADNNSKKLMENYFQYLENISGLDAKKNLEDIVKDKKGDFDFCFKLKNSIRGKCTTADEQFLDSLYRWCKIIEERKKLLWGYQAHHIIPIEQIFNDFEKISFVANLGKSERVFDINCAENCIMLPSYNHSEKYDTIFDKVQKSVGKIYSSFFKTTEEKNIYEVMLIAEKEHRFKMQWHAGGHSYEKQISKDMRKMIGGNIKGGFKDYTTALEYEIQKIENCIDLENICPAEIRKRILNLIDKVRNSISAFHDHPTASYPYFVSRASFLYAFELVQKGEKF
ncbi:MAG: AHH domain-containing protein [Selenomonadaceae bacterium]|nr:AHH domain-containing protein [Selenomonadaceae bacterium]